MASSSASADRQTIVIGLDFGTTYTGVAFCDKSAGQKVGDVQLILGWPGVGAAASTEKVPSRIAYQPPPENSASTDMTIYWGNLIRHNIKVPVHACMKLRLDEKQDGNSIPLTALIRLLMGDFEGLSVNEINAAIAGPSEPTGPPPYPGKDVVDIVADYLSEVRKHAYNEITKTYGQALFKSMKRELVVTVPAVWSEKAKDLTLKAVSRAQWGAETTWLVTEPEAAAIYSLRTFMEGAGKSDIKVGDTLVLCDAGGGTVDLISYRITRVSPNFKIEEAAVGSGDKCGATYVEKEFLTWLETWIGKARYEKIPSEKKRHGSSMLNSFEQNKMQFTGEDDEMPVRLPTEAGLTDDDALNIEDGSVNLTNAQMKSFFDPCINRVLELVDGQVASVMQKNNGVRPKLVLLVGGFGRSDYLHKKVAEYCTARGMQCRRPVSPWSAVVKGAVCRGLEGRTGGLVDVRLARKHYGTPVMRAFNPRVHSEADAYLDPFTGHKMARGQMAWLCEKEARLPEDKPKAFTLPVQAYFTLSDTVKEVAAMLVGCPNDVPPSKSNHPDVKVICRVRADFSDIPITAFPRMRNPATGHEYYAVDCDLEARFLGGELTWRLLYQGREWGSTKVSFDD